MRIGRLLVTIGGSAPWGFNKGCCGCKILDIGFVSVTWMDKNCKCGLCGNYLCQCSKAEEDLF